MPDTFVHGIIRNLPKFCHGVYYLCPGFGLYLPLNSVAWRLNVLSFMGMVVPQLNEASCRLFCHNADCIYSVLSLYHFFRIVCTMLVHTLVTVFYKNKHFY